MRLARRPASHPPDQRQDSAVTYVALCVVSAIAIKKLFYDHRADAPRRYAVLDALRPLCGAPRHTRVAMSVMSVYGSGHLCALTAPHFEGSK
ncbi:hypothetical protein BW686_18140 [Pseudomonas syringae]|uniref:Uncharacterized protein n=1 Tax=Pseudomonas syringae TaxID=317 RepID=A0A244ENZ0_PSESX|nr:hypothetical protein BW686_18140 [Pseudomonas syringae]